jgi:hypothetical protein
MSKHVGPLCEVANYEIIGNNRRSDFETASLNGRPRSIIRLFTGGPFEGGCTSVCEEMDFYKKEFGVVGNVK